MKYRVATLFVVLAFGNSVAAELKPLPIEAVMKARSIDTNSDLAPSPDNRWIAFVLSPPRGPTFERGSDIMVADRRTGKLRNLTAGKGFSSDPAWSPDGRYLAFHSDRDGSAGLWVWNVAEGKLLRVTSAVLRPAPIHWLGDSRHIIVTAVPEGEQTVLQTPASATTSSSTAPAAQGRPNVRVLSAGVASADVQQASSRQGDTRIWRDPRSDVAAVDIKTNTLRRIVQGIHVSWMQISPNGKLLALACSYEGNPHAFELLVDLFTVRLNDGGVTKVAETAQMYTDWSISWSPDSRWLAYVNNTQQRFQPPDGEVHVASADGQVPATVVPTTPHAPFDSPQSVPLWSPSGDTLYLLGGDALWAVNRRSPKARKIFSAPDKRPLLMVSRSDRSAATREGATSTYLATFDSTTGLAGIVRVDLATGAATTLVEEQRRYRWARGRGGMVATKDGTVVYIAEGPGQPEAIWTLKPGGQPAAVMSEPLNPGFSGITYGRARQVRWTDAQNRPASGSLLLPANYEAGRRYPLILSVYGEALDQGNGFGFRGDFENMQLLATRGYAVLYPDIPRRFGDQMKQNADTALPGIERVIELGIADPERIGVIGHSFGGYTTLTLIVQSGRFKAAVDSAGPANWLSTYGGPLGPDGRSGGIPYTEGQERLDHPWAPGARERYIANSPWFFLDRVSAAVLILHGGADNAALPGQSDAVFTALKRLGKTVEYALYAGEPHAPHWWHWENKRDALERYLRWFDRHLKGS